MNTPEESDERKRKRLLEQKLGIAKPTYSAGKISEDDEGDVVFAMACDKERKLIHLDFGKPVKWFAFELEHAKSLRECLDKCIKELEELP